MDIYIREGILTPEIFKGLRTACGMPELEPELLERAVKSSLFTLSAVSGLRTVGMVRLVGDGAFVFVVVDLLVVPLWRRQGIGSRLVEEAILRARSSVPSGRSVVVSLFSVEGREAFYTRLGFTELPAVGLGAGMQYFCH
jgi:GNAT superfamily N-acetyltransferase